MLEKINEFVFAFYPSSFGSNVFILLTKPLTLIDSSLQSNAFELISALKELNIKPEEINLILHTHGHVDHFANDILFPNALIRMHEFDALKLKNKNFAFTASDKLENNFFPEINSFFKEKELIDLNELKLKVIFTPGHTKGSVCFHEKKFKLLFAGDTLFEKSAGRTDLISGNTFDLIESLKKLEVLDFKTLLSGHGKAFKGNQKKNIEFIRKTYL